MKIAASLVVCLLLLDSLGDIAAYATRESKTEKRRKRKRKRADDAAGSCPSQPSVEAVSSVLVDAGSTGSIHFRPERFQQSFNEECHSEEAREYRSADGACNHVFNLGSANTPYKRLLPPAYGDSVNTPRSFGEDGSPLPSATDVSRMILASKDCRSGLTTMFMQWGQFVDHDVVLTPVSTKSPEGIKCCGPNGTYPDSMSHSDCFPIRLSQTDANNRFHGNCMGFVRSVPARNANGHQIVPREQVNLLTSFLDGSMIYGSSLEQQRRLRETAGDGEPGARMKMTGDNLLPNDTVPDCILREGEYCFLAGDVRVNVQPGLAVMHTLWVRLHNLVVEGLVPHRPDDTEEELFQEARKVVVGILQNIHYGEWLPLVIGNNRLDQYGLRPLSGHGQRVGYSASVDPRIFSAFSTAAFRFGHSNIPEHLNVSGQLHRFQDMFFRPDLVFEDFDGVVQALIDTFPDSQAQNTDINFVDDITGHLFEPATQEKGAPSHGLDLAALNIQRGRDHGLLPFNKFRMTCGLPPVEDFSEFGESASSLSLLYSSVEDLDLFVGGLLETPEDDAQVGPTFACIIAQQFHALKFGDRFYFETDRMPEGFTDDQLEAIRGVTMGHVSCATSNIASVQENVFVAGDQTQDCDAIRNFFLDFSLWQN